MLLYTIENGYYSPFSTPNFALSGNYENYYWEDFLHQKFDNNSYTSAPLLLAFMQRRADNPEENVLDSYDYVLQNLGSSLSEAFIEFIVWNFYTGSRAVQGFGYDEAGIVGFPEVQLKATHNSYPTIGSGSNLGHLSSNHILLYPGGQGGLKINFDGSDDVSMEAVVTWANGSSVTWEKINLGVFNAGELFTDTKSFGALLPIVTAKTGSGFSYTYSIDPATVYNISFTNQIGSTNAGGNFVVDGDTYDIIPSGQSRNLVEQRTHNAKTNNERFIDWNGNIDYKHHDWNDIFSEFKLLKNLQAIPGNNQFANFSDMRYSKIEAKLEGSFISGKGDFQFQDPWYAFSDNSQPENFWISANGMYEPTGKEGATDKGVFLNQGGTSFTPPYYSVQAQQIQNINLGSPQGTRTFYFQNWSGTEVQFENASALQTGVVFKDIIPSVDPIVSANYKGHLLSNNSTGFSSNSQRKFISDANGNKHLVYESQGNVWYTKSTNNGSTWLQEVKLNDDGTQAKGATFAYSSGDGYMYILYQCDQGTWGNPNPTLILCQYYYGTLRWREEVCELSSYAFNTTPTISAVSGVVLVVYKPNATGGLVGKEYWLNSGNITLIYDRIIPGTTPYSINPSLATTVLTQPTKHMLVYQESYYGIYYKQWTVTTDFANLVTSNLSSGVGYSLNSTPSIVDVPTGSRLCWVGSDYSGTSKRVVFRDPENLYQFWTFGNLVASPSINKTDGNSAYFIGWSDGNGSSFKIVDSHLSYAYIKTLTGLQGSAMQLSNGSGANTMYAMTFYNGGLPYALTQSNSLVSYSMSKENTNSNIASGRAGIVMKGEGEFSFMLGDIEVNSEKIRFKKLSDTLTIPSKDVFNTLVESDPFELKENSSFTYSVEYGVTDSALAAQALQNVENVKFKVELIDAATNQIINTFDNVTYTKDFLQKYNSLAYQVNTEAIGTMNVKLRLVADHTGEANYQINNSFVEDEIIAKKGFKVINLKNELQIKDYALAQNYPNPFNPVTTITYQLPKSGSVTLKIFDILGNEVKTLVNENKEMGRYTVQFDASSLASGMYVYQLRANDYTSTKKMMLLK